MRSDNEPPAEINRLPGESVIEITSDSGFSADKIPTNRPRLNTQNSKFLSFNKVDERVPLLGPRLRRSQHSQTWRSSSDVASSLRHLSPRRGSFRNSFNSQTGVTSAAFTSALCEENSIKKSHGLEDIYERAWYDQFTSTDWVRDSITDAHRVRNLSCRKDIRGRLKFFFDGYEGYILSAIVGFFTATVAYLINVSETHVFDWKEGYCLNGFFVTHKQCCPKNNLCDDWKSWSNLFHLPYISEETLNFLVFVFSVIAYSTLACLLTLSTKITIVPSYQTTRLDHNFDASNGYGSSNDIVFSKSNAEESVIPMSFYPVAGSGVAEVRVILSGFVLHRFLGVRTLVIKSLALVLSISSGLSLGKEGPFVHIATCIGNIACRLFSKYEDNDGKLREVLSAAAAAGVAVAFGAPIGGILFSLEEVAFFFTAKTLFRTFFCSIIAALTLKFLNPYGTNKIVMFEIRYVRDWQFFELVAFILIGILGGGFGAFFVKASRLWAYKVRPLMKNWHLLEVFLVALVTGAISFWNPLTKLSAVQLLYNLASPCGLDRPQDLGLCPLSEDKIILTIYRLITALLIKVLLIVTTFGIKVPAGIYVPALVIGGLGGRIIGHLMQILVMRFSTLPIFKNCAADTSGLSCITPGVYALVAAGSTMCGVTRLSVTLAVILFEITGSLGYVLPCSLAILVAKWTADAFEPQSIYDLLTEMNFYPLLSNKEKPVFLSELSEIVPRARREKVVDISNSPLVMASNLQSKLELLQKDGEFDGALPIIRNRMLVGLLPAPDLEFALDNIEDKSKNLFLMSKTTASNEIEIERNHDYTDISQIIDPAPLSIDIQSSMDLVYQCFLKLGLRYLCVLQEGRYVGMIHKKAFVQYIRQISEKKGFK
ncbi:putative voltage gated chloride channel [Erysiphe necator]|uniref:Putative voltage gated chloride channel n=1 Tax=Uncinula necator TaxID=52586 RepID=A0A0B1P123_UNCNE|nr:putative voltage gated chloride channel [Erysiphe necator]